MKLWNTNKILLLTLTALAYVVLWVPVVIVIVFSFSNDKLGIKWEGFTFSWYAQIYNNVGVRDALTSSLFITSITVVVATIVGTLAAYGLYKYKFRGRKFLRMSILLPITIPYIVTAGALLVFYTRVIHIPLGYPGIIIAHITFSIPLVVFIVLGRMARIDWTLEEASADLGAHILTTWRKITVPLLLPAILASAVIVFPWSFNDFTITYFVAGLGTTTLPIYVFSQMVHGFESAMLNAIGAFFIILPIIFLLLINLLRTRGGIKVYGK